MRQRILFQYFLLLFVFFLFFFPFRLASGIIRDFFLEILGWLTSFPRRKRAAPHLFQLLRTLSSMYLDTWAVVGFSSKRSVTKCQRASVVSVSLKVWSLRSKSPVKTLNRPRRGWCLRPVQGTLHWARYAAAVARHLCAPASCLALAGYSVSWRGTQALHSSELV